MKYLFKCMILIFCTASSQYTVAKKMSFGSYGSRSYIKKAPCAGLGKISPVTKQIKTKVTSGHVKRTCRGMTHVNAYARTSK